jgi:hypothetical protein
LTLHRGRPIPQVGYHHQVEMSDLPAGLAPTERTLKIYRAKLAARVGRFEHSIDPVPAAPEHARRDYPMHGRSLRSSDLLARYAELGFSVRRGQWLDRVSPEKLGVPLVLRALRAYDLDVPIPRAVWDLVRMVKEVEPALSLDKIGWSIDWLRLQGDLRFEDVLDGRKQRRKIHLAESAKPS